MSILIRNISTGQEKCNTSSIKYIVTLPKINKKTIDKIKPPLIADLSPLLIERYFLKDIIKKPIIAINTIKNAVIQKEFQVWSFIVLYVFNITMVQTTKKIAFAKRIILKNNHNLDNLIKKLGFSSIFPFNS
jgi:hypothetical protein